MTDHYWGRRSEYSPTLHLIVETGKGGRHRTACGLWLRRSVQDIADNQHVYRCRTCAVRDEPLVCICPVAYSDGIGQCTCCWRVITHHPRHPLLADGWPELADQPIHYQLRETA